MLSAVIVEDEIPASERLKVLLKDCDITVLASFRTATPALNWFETHQADIVFVDIGLPEITGLQFVERLPHICKTMPAIIFTTAYEEHALKAFDLAATDYLLKPIKLSRLKDALARIATNHQDKSSSQFESFSIIGHHRIVQIPWQQTAYLMADQKVVWLYTYDKQVYELPKTLVYWEQVLGDKALRIHRNALVMRHALAGLVRLDENTDENDNNARWGAKIVDYDEILPVSRRQLSILRKELG
ncbi:MAG: response regulator [Neisseriaceae bacterium]|nr:response regulator [Neisseriaceae bacterium]MBR1818525.1 response regulator [Neisseriaceae bacterium]